MFAETGALLSSLLNVKEGAITETFDITLSRLEDIVN